MAYILTITIKPAGAGGVILSPRGDTIAGSTSWVSGQSYPAGTVVTITAVPCYISGGYFDHWGGAISGTTNPIAIIMNSNKSVDVNYYVPAAAPIVTLTTGVEGTGSVTPSSGVFNPGDQVILVATPASGYAFDSWSGDIDGTSPVSGMPNHLLVTMDKDRYIIARFTAVSVVTRYWITVAEGATLNELKADAEAKYVDGPFRLVMEALSAPSWMLASGAWLVNALKAPLNAVGINLTEVKVKDKIIYVYMHGSPHLISIFVGIFITGLIVLGILYLITNPKVQQEITERAAIELRETETKQEVTDVLLEWARETGASPEAVTTLLRAVWDSGYTPEAERVGIDWEKYLKWGLIGGGVILGAAVLIPAIIGRK